MRAGTTGESLATFRGAANPTGSGAGSKAVLVLTKGGCHVLGADPGPGVMQFFI